MVLPFGHVSFPFSPFIFFSKRSHEVYRFPHSFSHSPLFLCVFCLPSLPFCHCLFVASFLLRLSVKTVLVDFLLLAPLPTLFSWFSQRMSVFSLFVPSFWKMKISLPDISNSMNSFRAFSFINQLSQKELLVSIFRYSTTSLQLDVMAIPRAWLLTHEEEHRWARNGCEWRETQGRSNSW